MCNNTNSGQNQSTKRRTLKTGIPCDGEIVAKLALNQSRQNPPIQLILPNNQQPRFLKYSNIERMYIYKHTHTKVVLSMEIIQINKMKPRKEAETLKTND
ncbi:hypothetical protein PanWU01x14_126880 [Parasponia andersonii]|uniref:Uncharacterized protein n=1 Tax=Parasponia andersonii TaxID=3476 RepID=A0A2P5CT71_PARAD|nr:hypothetical protein PanWU01x14_126880 [Parasponia andersonii]